MSVDGVRSSARTTTPARSSGLRPIGRTLVERTLLRWGVRPLLAAADVSALTVSVLLTRPWRTAELGLVALLAVVACGAFAAAGLYRSRLTLTVLDDLPRLLGRVLAAGALVASLAGAVVDEPATRRVLLLTGCLAVVLPLARALAYAFVRSVRARGAVAHPTLVVGAGQIGSEIGRTLQDHPEFGLRPVGFLDADPLVPPELLPVPVLGGQEALASVIVEFGVRDVIVAFGAYREQDLIEIIRTCDRLDCEMFFVPRLFELHRTSHDMDEVRGIPLVRLHRSAFRSPLWAVKRALDVVLSAAALLALLPTLAVCALAVRLEGGPGVLFRQERVGLDRRPFQVLKLRSLRPVDESESAERWSIAHDDRLGPVGRFLRQTSLDELPQLWNVLRGDMTLVGPRPERPHFVDEFERAFPRYTARHRVPAGLTGWAQVNGLRGDTSIAERAHYDNYYIENWSLWLDVKILLRTVGCVLRRSGG